MNLKETLHTLQSQPDSKKKMIVWGVTILLGIGLLVWWFGNMKNTIGRNGGPTVGEQLQFDKLQEGLNDIPVQNNGEQ